MEKQPVINVTKTAGFCFGVRRAIRMAHELAKSESQVHMLGNLVHNQEVIAQIKKTGIKKIERLGNGRGKTLLIRAHGASNTLIEQAKKHGYLIVDATCPMVHVIHKIVRRMDRLGHEIIVIGDRRHDEVEGIAGQTKPKALIIDKITNIPWKKIKKYKKTAIVVQSTQNSDHVLPIVEALRARMKSVKFFNTICRPTRMKQAEMKTLPIENDVVIVIGSYSSANTKKLYQIARALNPHSYWVESAAQLKQVWFKNTNKIGITAGASTPESTIQATIARIKTMALRHLNGNRQQSN